MNYSCIILLNPCNERRVKTGTSESVRGPRKWSNHSEKGESIKGSYTQVDPDGTRSTRILQDGRLGSRLKRRARLQRFWETLQISMLMRPNEVMVNWTSSYQDLIDMVLGGRCWGEVKGGERAEERRNQYDWMIKTQEFLPCCWVMNRLQLY